MTRIKALTFLIFLLSLTACNTSAPSPEPNVPSTIAPTKVPNPTSVVTLTPTQERNDLPISEAGVPRVSVENAKAAFDSGQAIIVDVRGKDAYDRKHIAGAISVPLGEIEINPIGLSLPKDKWIITYCT